MDYPSHVKEVLLEKIHEMAKSRWLFARNSGGHSKKSCSPQSSCIMEVNLLYPNKKQRKTPMLKDLEAQKAKAKETMNRILDEYYEKYSERSNAPKFMIDVIEKLMLEQQTKARETFAEINSELASSGAIESANKVILQRRLKQAGMRWDVGWRSSPSFSAG